MAATNAFEVTENGVRLLMPSNEIFAEAAEVDLTPVLEASGRHQADLVRPYTRGYAGLTVVIPSSRATAIIRSS